MDVSIAQAGHECAPFAVHEVNEMVGGEIVWNVIGSSNYRYLGDLCMGDKNSPQALRRSTRYLAVKKNKMSLMSIFPITVKAPGILQTRLT